jgi:hypothetical protein
MTKAASTASEFAIIARALLIFGSTRFVELHAILFR